MTIVQEVTDTTPQPGDTLAFSITVQHQEGVRYAEEVLIFEELPAFLDIVHAETSWGDLTVADNQVRVEIGYLLPDDVVQVYIIAQMNDQPAPEQLQVIASVATATEDRVPWNDTAAVMLTMR
jgi:hypothetical protein